MTHCMNTARNRSALSLYKKNHVCIVVLLLLFVPLLVEAQNIAWQGVEKTFGRSGSVQGNVFKVTFPRTDLNVKVGAVSIEPGLALTSWIAFLQDEDRVMMMGDLVLTEREIKPVMKALLRHNIEVTALHNHITGESPKIMYVHFGGNGNAEELARIMMDVLSKTKTPLKVPAKKAAKEIDWTTVEQTIGTSGNHSGNILNISIPRSEPIREHQMEIPPAMGMTTAINFQMVGKKAAVTGDFVLTAEEVQPVLNTLNEHGIAVTALHNHMIFESPRLFFMHFWGVDDPQKLATGLRAAIEKTNSLIK